MFALISPQRPQHSAVGIADFGASLPGFAFFANNH
jgi:hypothetical protein